MKLSLISEALNLAKYKNEIDSIIQNCAIESVSVVLTSSAKSLKNSNSDFNVIFETVYNKCIEFFKNNLAKHLSSYGLTLYGGRILIVKFIQLEGDEGMMLDEQTIAINKKFIEQSMNHVFRIIYNMVSGDDNQKMALFSMSKDELKGISLKNNHAATMIRDTFIHEMTHVIQASRQAHRDELDYYSYGVKGKENFLNIMNGSKKVSDDESHFAYMTSPHEIQAISHNVALEIIDRYEKNKSKIDINSKEVKNFIDQYLKSHFKNLNDPLQQKVYRRYTKLIYKELKDYIES